MFGLLIRPQHRDSLLWLLEHAAQIIHEQRRDGGLSETEARLRTRDLAEVRAVLEGGRQ